METTSPNFANDKEAIQYWRNLAIEYKESAMVSHGELNEFQISTRELEEEYELQLLDSENKNKDMVNENFRTTMELKLLQETYEKAETESFKMISNLKDKVTELSGHKHELQKYLQSLEQTNDDLERSKRATLSSLEDFEYRLNQALERNVFLEGELEERESLKDTIQHLKDEARDLRHELAIQKPASKPLLGVGGNGGAAGVNGGCCGGPSCTATAAGGGADGAVGGCVTTGTGHQIHHCKHTPVAVITASRPSEPLHHDSPTTPTSNELSPKSPRGKKDRKLVLNVVADLLKKVASLETKLSACKIMYPENQKMTTSKIPSKVKQIRNSAVLT